jgi:hypothetical protein
MKVHPILTVALAGTLAAGCVGSKLDRSFAAGQYSEVVRLFEADPALQVQETPLYHAALAYGLPESPAYEPGRAIETLERLLRLHPNTSHRDHALHLHQLLDEVRELSDRELRHQAELHALSERLEEQRQQLGELEEELATEKTRADALRTISDRLDREVRERDNQIRALQEELTGLKEIDLNRPSTERVIRDRRGSSQRR